MKKELYINTNKDSAINFIIASMLSERTYPWFYEKFINLIMYNHENQYALGYVDNKMDDSTFFELIKERAVLRSMMQNQTVNLSTIS